ncbi:hypothetical protein ASE81_16200 [Sphingomonas sp. Leaf29]|nr:hypothetical protein ASE81_16200 [Sphingomonas sp. Leaf29]
MGWTPPDGLDVPEWRCEASLVASMDDGVDSPVIIIPKQCQPTAAAYADGLADDVVRVIDVA